MYTMYYIHVHKLCMCFLCANILPTGICIAQKARRQRYSIHFVCTTNKNKYQQKKKRKQQQKQTKNQRNKVVYFLFLSFLQPQKLQILFINRCVRHKSESCHSPDMVGEPLFFLLLLLLFVFLLPLRRIADRPRHTHTYILRCEYRPRLGQQRERERARWRQLSVAFSLLLMLSTSVCSSPLLSLLRFVSEINSEIHFLFGNCWERGGVYLASLSRACTCNWRCWHIAFGLPDVSQYGRCCSVLFIPASRALLPSLSSGGLALGSASLIVSSITCCNCLCYFAPPLCCRDL